MPRCSKFAGYNFAGTRSSAHRYAFLGSQVRVAPDPVVRRSVLPGLSQVRKMHVALPLLTCAKLHLPHGTAKFRASTRADFQHDKTCFLQSSDYQCIIVVFAKVVIDGHCH